VQGARRFRVRHIPGRRRDIRMPKSCAPGEIETAFDVGF
jgi:hypothetical protein